MRCDDGSYSVVKFRNNPQGLRILANEMLASKLALLLGLPVCRPDVVEVPEAVVRRSPELYLQCGTEKVPCAPGLHFGSVFPCDPLQTAVYDFVPDKLLYGLEDLRYFPGMLAFDKWTCNCDARQVVFYAGESNGSYRAKMIDQGFCFNASEWSFPDTPMRGLFLRMAVYAQTRDWSAFEPFLSRIENLDDDLLEEAAASVPPEWYAGEVDEFRELVRALAERRSKVRGLLAECIRCSRSSFPNWREEPAQG